MSAFKSFFKTPLPTILGTLTPPGFLLRWAGIASTFHFVLEYVGECRLTEGPSMLPTLKVRGDCVYVNKFYRRGLNVVVGDVVSFRHPIDPDSAASKRVLGMPGDFVLRDSPGRGSDQMIQVPEGHCWVAGDNGPWSRDSRDYGPLPLALIKGRVMGVIWPFSERRWLENTLQNVDGRLGRRGQQEDSTV